MLQSLFCSRHMKEYISLTCTFICKSTSTTELLQCMPSCKNPFSYSQSTFNNSVIFCKQFAECRWPSTFNCQTDVSYTSIMHNPKSIRALAEDIPLCTVISSLVLFSNSFLVYLMFIICYQPKTFNSFKSLLISDCTTCRIAQALRTWHTFNSELDFIRHSEIVLQLSVAVEYSGL